MIERLSRREREVLELLAGGRRYKEIASSLGISESSVNVYVRRAMAELEADTPTQAAVILASEAGRTAGERLAGR
ncbi:MAG: response regulator transcription factor [Candidatus Limnocylindria bacterium]